MNDGNFEPYDDGGLSTSDIDKIIREMEKWDYNQ